MIPQIVYVLVANENNFYLEEMWVSIYSLRYYHAEAEIKVLIDNDTADYLDKFSELKKLITEIIVVPTPENFNAKQRSRQIKTTIRDVIKGNFLFIDTDTVICKPLDEISSLNSCEGKNSCPILAVPDGHLPLNKCLFPPIDNVKRIYSEDCSDAQYWFNSGVMYVKDSQIAHEFYKRWNENWKYSCFEKNNSQDQPALLKTDKEFGYIIKELPGIYNAQVAMSLKYFADAAILHWWHMDFIEDQSYSPYFSLSIYKEIKESGTITPHITGQILNVKQSFLSPSMPVGKDQILFLFSPVGKLFCRIHREGGAASWFVNKLLPIFEWIRKSFPKNH